jgi:hypothetical protein
MFKKNMTTVHGDDKTKTNSDAIYLKDSEMDNKYASAEFTINEDPFRG